MKSLRATIAEELKKTGVDSICSYGIKWEKGERLQVNDVCYARATWYPYSDGDVKKNTKGKIVELAASLEPAKYYSMKHLVKLTHIRKWVDYIINRSHFKDCFKTKNVQAAWRYGVQMDVKKPVGQVIASLIALRECWEFKDIPVVFNLLTNNGINEHVAFLLSRMVYVGKEGYEQKGFGGHQAIGSSGERHLKAFIKEGLNAVDTPLEDNPTSYKIYRSTRTDPYENEDADKGRNISDMLFAGGKKKITWEPPTVTKKQLIANAKKIEKELLS